jgi:hypothetical protein
MRLSITTQNTLLPVSAEWAVTLSCRMMAFSATYGHFSLIAHRRWYFAFDFSYCSFTDHLEVMTHKYTLDVIGQNDHQLRGWWILSDLVFLWWMKMILFRGWSFECWFIDLCPFSPVAFNQFNMLSCHTTSIVASHWNYVAPTWQQSRAYLSHITKQ